MSSTMSRINRFLSKSQLTNTRFISLLATESQSFVVSRFIPYKYSAVYDLIADIDSYSEFLPYCLHSEVTKKSLPDQNGRSWPSEANLKVGWGGIEESFTSRVFCLPGSIVEALGGEAATSLPKDKLAHHINTIDAPALSNNIFRSLRTRWMVRSVEYGLSFPDRQEIAINRPENPGTEVHLSLDFQFSNPLYSLVSKSMAPKVAGMMIEAFETRARLLLERQVMDK
ncbi:BgTH12-02890 [Blumeria graminis f. sp. triticale]|uniref:Bgt-315 n=3 Tax=Blumeria graminis TaxID=34373 RepID=A0A381L3C5_BLUGR|nr:Coenzyme Q binding protein [Blumeria graminis f. sp. tritici 96224]CAD6503222.1 BgTH12-02890 [Blumeria graminis f. sp. triticale]VDB89196.1 Bgt-315 [Blumeria graminis f. sp. tritici]